MNMLNSVILEGVVSEGMNEDGVFTICSSRYSKVGEDLVEEKTFIKCLCSTVLADSSQIL